MTKRRCLAVLTLVAASGCSSLSEEGPSTAPPTIRGSVAPIEQNRDVQSGEHLFIELSKVAPSSAGFAYEDDRLTIYIADERDRPMAEAFVQEAVRTRRILPPGGGKRIGGIGTRKVAHSYQELAAYRTQVADLLLGKDHELHFVDLDERANTVTLGYSGDESALIAKVRKDLPAARTASWLRVERSQRLVLDKMRNTPISGVTLAPASLTAQADTIVGGLMITRLKPDGTTGGCTLGFTAKRNNVVGFVTNSHCTEDMFGMGGPNFRAFGQLHSRIIGSEAVDPYGYTCGVAPPTECRGSDAAWIQSNLAVPYRVGFLAKPASRNTGALNISQSEPYIRIASTGTAAAGTTVEKFGMVTGWTSGYLTHTCVTSMIWDDGFWKRVACADKTLYHADEGDSGGPVWLWLPYNPSEGGTQASLLGIHASREWEGNSKYFSRIDRILSDLEGTWEILGPVPSSPLQAWIWGWTDVSSSASCQLSYSAHATGGAGGYTFSSITTDGTVVNSGSNTIVVAFSTSGSHWVHVTVTDAAGMTASRTFTVQSEASNNECYGAPFGNPF